jgi:hypothetical protein
LAPLDSRPGTYAAIAVTASDPALLLTNAGDFGSDGARWRSLTAIFVKRSQQNTISLGGENMTLRNEKPAGVGSASSLGELNERLAELDAQLWGRLRFRRVTYAAVVAVVVATVLFLIRR